MKVYIETNNLQLEFTQHRKQMLTLSKFIFAKRQIQCTIAHRLGTKVSGRFEHKPVQTRSFLNGNRGL